VSGGGVFLVSELALDKWGGRSCDEGGCGGGVVYVFLVHPTVSLCYRLQRGLVNPYTDRPSRGGRRVVSDVDGQPEGMHSGSAPLSGKW